MAESAEMLKDQGYMDQTHGYEGLPCEGKRGQVGAVSQVLK